MPDLETACFEAALAGVLPLVPLVVLVAPFVRSLAALPSEPARHWVVRAWKLRSITPVSVVRLPCLLLCWRLP